MKVQTKITLLLGLVLATFLVGVLSFRTYDRIKFRRIAQERFAERTHSFDEFLQRNGEPLQTLVEDFTCLDQTVNAVAHGDQQWGSDNLNDSTLNGYHANAVWIYPTDGTLVYSRNNLGASELNELPIQVASFPLVFKQERLRHFFIRVPEGIMEVRAGTIHPSKDFGRSTAPRGYLFAGRLWNKPTLAEMSAFTGNKIEIVPPVDGSAELRNDERQGLITFNRVLTGWDGQPVGRLIVRSESQLVRELNKESEVLLLSLIVFALLLILLISSSLVRWVRRPLSIIAQSLKRDDPSLIKSLSRHDSEFGQLARTVRTFFEQRDNLVSEMEERRATEEALRKKEDELRHAQKLEAVGRLAGGVAHDFNNLLTAIIGYAELLIRQLRNEPLRQHAEVIRHAGDQAAILTRQLLAFSRKQILQPRVMDLNRLVVEMEKLLRRVIGERFELKTIPQASDGRVKADPAQLEQVVLNLGVNARDAMPAGGKLEIRTSNIYVDGEKPEGMSNPIPSGDYVVLTIADTGTGMDADTQSKIFEPFFTTKGPGKGTGLGLATVYGIIRQSGGGIAVDSEIGRGTTFQIFLPHETGAIAYTKPPSEDVIAHATDSETVLVVEDEEIVRQLVCDVLEDQGYKVLCAADGREALKLSAEFNDCIHLLITDVIMPEMNGPELAEAISAARPEIKILFVSGYSDADLDTHCGFDSGASLLQKPFTPAELGLKIRQMIGADIDEASTSQMQLSI